MLLTNSYSSVRNNTLSQGSPQPQTTLSLVLIPVLKHASAWDMLRWPRQGKEALRSGGHKFAMGY
jgi:hypothetical protein